MHEAVRILVVDDRASNRDALVSALASPDYDLVAAESGAAALRFLLRDECALILMDVNMPALDGYETARLIRENPRTRNIPIVFVTAHGADDQKVLEGYETGAVDYLFKPVSADVLRSKVASFAALHRAQRQLFRQAELLREHERREHAHALAQLELASLKKQDAARRRHQFLLEGLTHAVVWVLEPSSGVCRYASPSATAILGFPPDRWTSEPDFWRERVPLPDRARFDAAARSLVVGGAGAVLEHRLHRADGRAAWFETALRLVADEESGALELRGFSVDITDAVQGREALELLARASAELSESLDGDGTMARAAALAVPVLADLCLVEVRADPAAPPVLAAAHAPDPDRAAVPLAASAALAGLAPGEELAPQARRLAADLPDLAAALEALAPATLVDVPLAARGRALGRLRLVLGAGRRHGTREAGLAAELGRRIAQAVENAILYGRARDAVALREQFLSIASHELRTPLAALLLQIRLLEQATRAGRTATPEDLRRRVGSAGRQVERLTALVNSLLDLARIRSGRMPIDPERCDLAEIARDVAERFQEELGRAGRVVSVLGEGTLPGRWDASRVDQVVTNLVANAARHGGAGPIRIELAARDGAARVTVADSGAGVPERERERIFELFAQGERSAAGGLGLGLFIARRIAEAHGGRLWVDSAPGGGAAFHLELPISPPEETTARPRDPAAPSQTPTQRSAQA